MATEDDVERSAAFDELLRVHAAATVASDSEPRHMQTLRLLHEVFRVAPSEAVSQSDSEAMLPDSIGRFRIQRMLGRGGFGTVYLAEDPVLNRHVALKLIHGHLLHDPAMRRRALREREAMARLQHPNIIPVWEASEDEGQFFIISEYCPGRTLAQWLTEHPGPLAASAAAKWVYRLADAVAHSHQRGVIHRDLKPGNILLDPLTQQPPRDPIEVQLEPRLSDFGLAKILDSSPSTAASLHTQAGLFVGSLEYASPEQVKGQIAAIGPATDIYALGVLLFQLLTGRLPFAADSQYELARCICEEHVTFPTKSTVEKDLQAITMRAMALEVGDRYASAEALRDDLGRFLRGESVEARPVSLVEQSLRLGRKRPAVTALALACCLLALMFLYNLVVSNGQLAEKSHALQAALQQAQDQTRLAEDGQKTLSKLRYRESIKLAFEQWQQHNYIGLYDTLERLESLHATTLESQHLRQQLNSGYLKFDLHDEPVQALAWHPQDKNILSISASGKLRRWLPNRATAVSEHHTAIGAHSLAIHPDGKTIALPENLTAGINTQAFAIDSKASNLTLWNAADASRNDKRLQFHSSTVESLEFSPDGQWLAAGPRYANVVVTELETQESFAIKSERRNRQVVFSPDSNRIAVYVLPGKIEIHDLRSRKLTTTLQNTLGNSLGSFYSLAWVPGHDALVVNARPERLQVYSAQNGQRIADVPAGIDAESIAVSPDGHRVVLGDNQGFVRLFDMEALLNNSADTVAITPKMRVLSGKITDVAFVDEEHFVAADEEGNMIRLKQPTGQRSLQLDAPFRQLHWHDNQHLWTFGYDVSPARYIKVDMDKFELITDLPPHADSEVARAQGSGYIASANREGRITVVDSQTGEQVSSCLLPPGKAVQSRLPVSDKLLFSEDQQRLYATGENNTICAIRARDGKLLWSKGMTNSGYCLAEDAEHGRLFLGGGFEALTVFDSLSGRMLSEHVGGNGTNSLFFDSKRNRLISGHHDGTVRDRGIDTLDQPNIHRLSTSGIAAVTLTPDNRTFITGDEEGVLRVADDEFIPFGVLYRSALPSAEVASLRWSPDRRRLAALIYSRQNPSSEIVIFDSGLAKDDDHHPTR